MGKSMVVRFPEHAKLEEVADQMGALGEFLDWLQREREVVLAVPHGADGGLVPIEFDWTDLIAEFYGIDQTRLAEEAAAVQWAVRAGQVA